MFDYIMEILYFFPAIIFTIFAVIYILFNRLFFKIKLACKYGNSIAHEGTEELFDEICNKFPSSYNNLIIFRKMKTFNPVDIIIVGNISGEKFHITCKKHIFHAILSMGENYKYSYYASPNIETVLTYIKLFR